MPRSIWNRHRIFWIASSLLSPSSPLNLLSIQRWVQRPGWTMTALVMLKKSPIFLWIGFGSKSKSLAFPILAGARIYDGAMGRCTKRLSTPNRSCIAGKGRRVSRPIPTCGNSEQKQTFPDQKGRSQTTIATTYPKIARNPRRLSGTAPEKSHCHPACRCKMSETSILFLFSRDAP